MRRSEQICILRAVIEKRQPELLPLVDKVGKEILTEEELERLRDLVSDEFAKVGLQDNDEPNPQGIVLDDIMGFLVPHECNPKEAT